MTYFRNKHCMNIQYRNRLHRHSHNDIPMLSAVRSFMLSESRRLELATLVSKIKSEEKSGEQVAATRGVVVNSSRVVVINAETLYLDGAALNRLLDGDKD